MKPILTLSMIPETKESNYYGYETVHIYAFNFDGRGTALVSHENSQEFDTVSGIDLHNILCGDPGDGTRWYQPVLEGRVGHATGKIEYGTDDRIEHVPATAAS